MISSLFFITLIVHGRAMSINSGSSSGSGIELIDYNSGSGEKSTIINPLHNSSTIRSTSTAIHSTSTAIHISENSTEEIGIISIIICALPCIFAIIVCLVQCFKEIYDYDFCYRFKEKKKMIIINNKLSNKYIKSLNKTNIQKIKSHECSICFEEVKKNQVTLNCGHVFHKKCLQPWIKQKICNNENPSCPTCRDIIYNKSHKERYIVYNISYDSDDHNDYNDYHL